MNKMVTIKDKFSVELSFQKLPENVWLVTSPDVQGLVVQSSSLKEAERIAIDLADQLLSK